MRKRQFGTKKLIYASEHNTAETYTELNIKEVVADAGLYGIISGGNLTPHPSTAYIIVMDELVARTSTGERIAVEAAVNIPILPSLNPGFGNEIWVTAYIDYAYARSEVDVDGDDHVYYKDYTNSYTISTIQGSIATIGNAVRPNIPADSVLLCDILYNLALYTSGDIQQSDIDITRRDEGGLDEYVRKDGDSMTGALTVYNRVSAEKIAINWATSTGYAIGDIISYGVVLYKCIVAHTSSVFATETANWTSVSGIGGSDVFTVTSTGETTFTLSFTPISKVDIIVSICGVVQHQSAFTLVSDTIIFTEALVANNAVQVLRLR